MKKDAKEDNIFYDMMLKYMKIAVADFLRQEH